MNNPYFQRRNKYNNQITEYNGERYHSKREAIYARQLDLLKNSTHKENRVVSYDRQVKFLLQPSFVDRAGQTHQKIEYIADFVVKYGDGRSEVVDVKGMLTDVYKIKKKMLLFKYPELNFVEE